MIRHLFVLVGLIIITSCKSDTKSKLNIKDDSVEDQMLDRQAKAFQKTLIDYRGINEQFTESYQIKGFGIQKNKNNLIGFVFKLDSNSTESTVLKYSLGIRIYDRTLSGPRNMSFNPTITEKGSNKYIIVEKKIDDMTYFDSISVYIYKRKDWKGSGRLGGFMVRDILFKDKK
ncbi:hypothetical protein [Winogradskyella poriferorum]|jgi:hypothetical protein|uniref:hypothetical protein n=1 Tax=Winogradskyella poriferorum TaxID=307627 RepID=UPI003D65772D